MQPALWSRLGLSIPIFAFSHCRDVVAAVSKAGGVGVYGAALSSDARLEADLGWIEQEVGDRPYGVDLLMPGRYVGREDGRLSPEAARSMIPSGHIDFLEKLMAAHGVADFEGPGHHDGLPGGTRYTAEDAGKALEVAFRFRPKLLVSALGTPPPEVVDEAHRRGMVVGALAGKVKHALAHQAAGVDVVIAQGYEAGGHTGEIAGMVLTPEVVDAVAPLPVLMAGGIARGRQLAAALALGAQGVWCGSVWLTTAESEVPPLLKDKLLRAGTSDTTRTRSFTGKPARFLRTPWSEEWDRPDTPEPLPTPLHSLAVGRYLERVHHGAEAPGASPDRGAGLLISKPVGQVVGLLNQETTCRQVILDMLDDCVEATARVNELLEAAG